MTKRLTKLIVRGRNKDGVPSYAIPLTKAEVAQLKKNDDDVEIYVDDNCRHGLILQSRQWNDYCEEHTALEEMFEKFWSDHPEIKDRDAYLKKYWEEQAKSNKEEQW